MSASSPSTGTPLTAAFLPPRRVWQWAARLIWRGLLHPWLLAVCVLLSLGLLAAIWFLPQLPGQLNDEPGTAARWLSATSAAYGVWGNLLLVLGLFNVLHSPLLQQLLVLIGVAGVVQLADQLGAAYQLARLPARLRQPAPAPAEPVPVLPLRPVFRLRLVQSAPPAETAAAIAAALAPRFASVAQVTVPVALPLGSEPGSPVETLEIRLLALRHSHFGWLRALLVAGLLMAVAGIWTAVVFGWQVRSPVLAPGSTYHSVNYGLEVDYPAPDETALPQVTLSMEGRRVTRTVESRVSVPLENATAQVRAVQPGLWVAAAGEVSVLARPGEDKPVVGLGLVFPSPGSEESLLLPRQAAGLRIVRRVDHRGFIVELYRSTEVQPVLRQEIDGTAPTEVRLDDGTLLLRLIPMPALQVDIRYLPGLWLAGAGLLAAALGIAGLWRRPAYLLAQVGPWPLERSVVILQSNLSGELALALPAPPTTTPPQEPHAAGAGAATSL